MRTPWRDPGDPSEDPTEPLPRIAPGGIAAPADPIFPRESILPPWEQHGDRRRAARLRRLSHVVGYLTGVIQGLLLVRFTFQLIGANPAAPAAALVYAATTPLVFLFENLFPVPRAGASAIELHVLFAFGAYTALGFALKRLVDLWLRDVRRRTRQ